MNSQEPTDDKWHLCCGLIFTTMAQSRTEIAQTWPACYQHNSSNHGRHYESINTLFPAEPGKVWSQKPAPSSSPDSHSWWIRAGMWDEFYLSFLVCGMVRTKTPMWWWVCKDPTPRAHRSTGVDGAETKWLQSWPRQRAKTGHSQWQVAVKAPCL